MCNLQAHQLYLSDKYLLSTRPGAHICKLKFVIIDRKEDRQSKIALDPGIANTRNFRNWMNILKYL